MAKKIFNSAVIIVTCLLTFMTCLLVYYKTIGKNKLPDAVVSTYATTITDPQTGEEKPVIEANYYSNYNKTGYEVVEILFNAYSGVSKQAIYSRGFQLVKDKDGKVQPYHFETSDSQSIDNNVWQYNRNGFGQSFLSAHDYSWGDKMIIDVDGKTYGVALDGEYVIHHKEFNLGGTIWQGVKNTFTLHWGRSSIKYDEWDEPFKYTWEDLLNKFKGILSSYSDGTGDSIIPLVDLGDFLHLYSYENGQLSKEPIGVGALQNSYFTVSAHYDLRGMTWAEQSLFGSVAGDSQFNISGIEDKADYWQSKFQYTINESMFDKRYVSTESGWYFALKNSELEKIKNFKNNEIIVVFDISKFKDIKVLGFDYYALFGVKIKTLTIKSNTQQDFKLLVNSLKDTGLTSETIKTQNVTLVNTQSGVEL